MSNITKISDFFPHSSDCFIFDTNILITIFYPTMPSRHVMDYTSFYSKIKKSKSTIYISSIHISEFINRCIRFQFDLYRKGHPEVASFKSDYRNTNDYRDSMHAILDIVKNDILSNFTKINDRFPEMYSENLFVYGISYDFNDSLVAELSRKYHAYLVTDDIDYVNFLTETNIITNNNKLLFFASKH